MGVVKVSCQLAPTQTLKKGVKTFWVQSVAGSHYHDISAGRFPSPLPSFLFKIRWSRDDWELAKKFGLHCALCSQWLFTIYLVELAGLRFGRIQNILNLVPE